MLVTLAILMLSTLTGVNEAAAEVAAQYRWQKIAAYSRMLNTTSVWDDSPDPGMLGLQDIGGYYP